MAIKDGMPLSAGLKFGRVGIYGRIEEGAPGTSFG